MIGGLATLPLAGCDEDGAWPVSLVSTATVDRLGQETWQRILAETPLSRDAGKTEATRRVARQLLASAGEDPQNWQVAVFARDEINAFALPGGRIGVFEGMFRVADSPGKLAAVIGHEIGHVQSRHGQERMNAEALRDLGLRVLFTALQLGDVPQADRIAAALGAGVEFGLLRAYSRRQELEADRRGLGLMTRSGFAGQEAVALWRRMDAMDGQGGPTFLATHPAPSQRIAALEKLLASGTPGG